MVPGQVLREVGSRAQEMRAMEEQMGMVQRVQEMSEESQLGDKPKEQECKLDGRCPATAQKGFENKAATTAAEGQVQGTVAEIQQQVLRRLSSRAQTRRTKEEQHEMLQKTQRWQQRHQRLGLLVFQQVGLGAQLVQTVEEETLAARGQQPKQKKEAAAPQVEGNNTVAYNSGQETAEELQLGDEPEE